MYYVLFYNYVTDIAERRGPHRSAHLALAAELHERGELSMAGAWADPLDGAAFIFRVPSRDVVEGFVQADPYVQNGLVTSWHIREWNVVIGV